MTSTTPRAAPMAPAAHSVLATAPTPVPAILVVLSPVVGMASGPTVQFTALEPSGHSVMAIILAPVPALLVVFSSGIGMASGLTVQLIHSAE